jgi:alpha-tubulin suppressor-like RCC1 family protein
LTFTTLSALGGSFCAPEESGSPYCWGYQRFGPPTLVAPGYRFLDIAASDTHICGVLVDHSALCWGDNARGALGNGTVLFNPNPTVVAGGHSFRLIRVAIDFSCGIDLGGTTYCWGANDSGQLGDGTTTERLVPTRVLGQP